MMTHQTSNYLLQLRPLTSDDAYAANRLGRGMVMQYYTNKDEAGFFLLRNSPAHNIPSDWIGIQTSVGTIHLEKRKAESLLNQLSSVPFVLDDQFHTEKAAWHNTLYNHYLHPDFRHLFGNVEPILPQTKANCWYELTWQQGDSGGTIQIGIDNTSLETLLDRAAWHSYSSLDLSALHFSAPICLGQLYLSTEDYCHLEPGDILLPTSTNFSSRGDGAITLAFLQLQINYQLQGTQPAYTVTHIENERPDDTTMYDEYDNTEDTLFDEDEISLFDENEDTSLNDYENGAPIHWSETQVTLKLQAGRITMSLQEIQQIHIGSVLVASGEAAGYATLYHGNRPIAQGELVDVEGSLGVQLTNVLLPPKRGNK